MRILPVMCLSRAEANINLFVFKVLGGSALFAILLRQAWNSKDMLEDERWTKIFEVDIGDGAFAAHGNDLLR